MSPLPVLALAVALAGCNARRGEPLRGPLELSAKERAGRKLFIEHCNQCHPGGEGGLGPALNSKRAPRFVWRVQIREGLGEMPSFDERRLSDEEVDRILDFVVALRRHR